jgi:hypothetical protein
LRKGASSQEAFPQVAIFPRLALVQVAQGGHCKVPAQNAQRIEAQAYFYRVIMSAFFQLFETSLATTTKPISDL